MSNHGEFLQAIKNPQSQYVFLLGAGASVAAHLPTGPELYAYLENRFALDLAAAVLRNAGVLDMQISLFCKELEKLVSAGGMVASPSLVRESVAAQLAKMGLFAAVKRDFENGLADFDSLVRQNEQSMPLEQARLAALRQCAPHTKPAEYIRQIILDRARRPDNGRWIINNCYDMLANAVSRWPGRFPAVFTTNFDPLIYYAFIQNWNMEPVLIRCPGDIGAMRPSDLLPNFPSLFYLHGYWQNYEVYISPEDFNRVRTEWWNALAGMWTKFDVIVLGYSGTQEDVALEWLRECLRSGYTVWWCLYAPNQTSNMVESHKHRVRATLGKGVRSNITGSVKFIPIESADDFAIELGCTLDLSKALPLKSATQAMKWFRPNDVTAFANGAQVVLDSRHNFQVSFAMGCDLLPGNNHAGINIDSVERQVDLSRMREICIRYSVREVLVENSVVPQFEFKLHSTPNAWSKMLPLQQSDSRTEIIPLAEYSQHEVDLASIWRIVIAADVRGLGPRGTATIVVDEVWLRE